MKTQCAEKARTVLGGICLFLLTFALSSCASERIVVRTKYVPVTRPETLSADCEKPKERPLEKTGELPVALKETQTALDDCAAQVSIGREFDKEVIKEVEKLNKGR